MHYKRISPTVADGTLYTTLFEAMPGNHMLLQANPPYYTILAVTRQRQIDVGLTKETVTGKPLFVVHPGNNTDPTDNGVSNLRSSLEHVMRYKELHHLPVQRYDLPNEDGNFSEKYWSASNSPVLDDEGQVAYILHTAEDITAEVKAEKKEEAHRELQQAYDKIEESGAQLKAVVEQTPAPTLVLRGNELRIELINEPMMQMMGRGEEVIGQPLLAVMPELKGQYTWEQVQGVYRGGSTFDQDEVLVRHNRTGVMQDFYYRVAYRPLKEDGQIMGMIQVALDVTEQVVSRKKLEESEERYRTLIEETTVATAFYTGPEIRIQYANATMLRYWGKGREVIGKTFREALPELEGQSFPGLLEAVYTTGESYIGTEEKAELVVDGVLQPFYFNFTYKALRDVEGRVYAIHHTAIDVTEQIEARQQLEKSEQELRLALDAGKMGTFVWHPQQDQGEPDERMLNLFGISKSSKLNLAEALGSMIHPDDGLRYAEEVKAAINPSGNGVLHSEFRITHPDQTVHWIAIHGQTYFDTETKAPVRMPGLATDITQQVEARKKLEESEARFRTLVEEAPVAMFIFRGEHMVIDAANKKALEMIGRTETVVGKPLLEAIPELTGSPAYQVFQEVYHSGLAQYGQEVLVPLERDGGIEKRYFNFVYTPLIENGQVVGVMDVATEVTEQVLARHQIEEVVAQRTKELGEANQALQDTNKELQRSNANLEEFAHAASHDLKEPIRKIHFFTTQLKDQLGTHLQEAEIRSFGRIENATERMGNLIDDLLIYSHVSQRPHEMESIDLNVKVQRVLEDLELDIAEKKAIVHVGKLPVVQGYRRQLQQLFQNLISNAIKYSIKDVPPHINITASEVRENGKQYHLIAVRDNGIGIAPEYADKIFQMFTRLHGKGEYSGTGVGLSIVKKVVENHHGFIKVESVPSKGSTFEIYLPI